MSPEPILLVADDDALVRELILTRLRLAGYQPYGARDGRDALARLRELKPQGLILDINMPEVDGFGVLGALRERGMTPALPVLVLTARHAADDVRKAIQLGAKDYLAKPFTQDQLMARVGRLLRPSRVAPQPQPTPRPAETLEI